MSVFQLFEPFPKNILTFTGRERSGNNNNNEPNPEMMKKSFKK